MTQNKNIPKETPKHNFTCRSASSQKHSYDPIFYNKIDIDEKAIFLFASLNLLNPPEIVKRGKGSRGDHYVVTRDVDYTLSKLHYLSGVDLKWDTCSNLVYPRFPLFSDESIFTRFGSSIVVPNKVYHALYNHGDRSLLKMIHEDEAVAIDMCMVFVSMITRYREIKQETINGIDVDEEKEIPLTPLHSQKLQQLFGQRRSIDGKLYNTYLWIIRALTNALDEPIIYRNGAYLPDGNFEYLDGYSKGVRLTNRYHGKGWNRYQMKTQRGKNIVSRMQREKLLECGDNDIVKKILSTYPTLTPPSLDEVVAKGKELSKIKAKTNSGKIIKWRGKKGKNYHKKGVYSFVEDSIKLWQLLTDGEAHNLIIPIVGDHKSGGRVVDSFTLMPSWIRKLYRFENGATLEESELDFSALHPNLSLQEWGTGEEHEKLGGDVHTNIAKELYEGDGEKDLINPLFKEFRNKIKLENVSFFNMTNNQMKKSFLYRYYSKLVPQMMCSLMFKKSNKAQKKKDAHKGVSQILFRREVELMTDIIKQLDNDDPCIYVYDCIYTTSTTARGIMNQTAKDYGLLTTV